MLNYYDEIKRDVLEVLENEEETQNILQSENDKDTIIDNLDDYFWSCDSVTGNGSGSYYFSSYKARKHCYNFFRDVFEALENYGHKRELANFKTFVALVEDGYLNIENMTLNEELLNEVDENERYCIFCEFEEIEEIDFETIDVITRCYMLRGVISKVVEALLK